MINFKTISEQIEDLLIDVLKQNEYKVNDEFYGLFINLMNVLEVELNDRGYSIFFEFYRLDPTLENKYFVNYRCKVYRRHSLHPETLIEEVNVNLKLLEKRRK